MLASKTFFTALKAGKENVTSNDFLQGFLDCVSSCDNVRPQNILGECSTHREYYTVARRYEFYVRVVRTISH